MFEAERRARCRAALSRDLSVTTTDHRTRQQYLADAARHGKMLPGSLAETLLITR